MGTLLAATAVGALADFAGGGAHGLTVAYAAVAASMVVMLLAALALRRQCSVQGAAHAA